MLKKLKTLNEIINGKEFKLEIRKDLLDSKRFSVLFGSITFFLEKNRFIQFNSKVYRKLLKLVADLNIEKLEDKICNGQTLKELKPFTETLYYSKLCESFKHVKEFYNRKEPILIKGRKCKGYLSHYGWEGIEELGIYAQQRRKSYLEYSTYKSMTFLSFYIGLIIIDIFISFESDLT